MRLAGTIFPPVGNVGLVAELWVGSADAVQVTVEVVVVVIVLVLVRSV